MEALPSCEKAIQLAPKFATAYLSKGMALLSLDYYKDALSSFEKAIKLDPKNAIYWFFKGWALQKLEKP